MVENSQQEHNHNDDRRDSFSSRLSEDDAHHLDDDTASLLSDRDNQTLLPTHHANASATSVFSFESIPMIPLTQTQTRAPELQKKVSFLNGLGLVIGSMIGSGLFSSPGKEKHAVFSIPILTLKQSGAVMEVTGAPGTALLVWLVSGLLALMGALCYAELGTMLPMNGGESVYLNRAFGSLLSFCFEFATIVVQKV